MSGGKDVKEITRDDLGLIERLNQFSVPELCDGAGIYRAMDYRIKPRVTKARITGRAFTVSVPDGEGGIIADAVEQVNAGDVLVIEGHGNCGCAYWGDHRSLCAKMRGAAGVVIDGAFRDLEGCEEVGFPVFAKGLTCGTADKAGTGKIGVPVSCGGVVVQPGDLIAADVNGVCVIRPEEAEWIMERAEKKREAQKRAVEEMKRTGEVKARIKVDW